MINAFESALLAEVRKMIAETMRSLERTIVSGTIQEFDDYRRLTGERKGMLTALELLDKAESKMLSAQPKQSNLR